MTATKTDGLSELIALVQEPFYAERMRRFHDWRAKWLVELSTIKALSLHGAHEDLHEAILESITERAMGQLGPLILENLVIVTKEPMPEPEHKLSAIVGSFGIYC